MAGLSWNGEGPYKQKIRNVRNIVSLYPQVFQWVVWADSDIKTIPDFKGKTLAIYVVCTDPGGSLPKWALNMATKISLPEIIGRVRKRVKNPKYED